MECPNIFTFPVLCGWKITQITGLCAAQIMYSKCLFWHLTVDERKCLSMAFAILSILIGFCCPVLYKYNLRKKCEGLFSLFMDLEYSAPELPLHRQPTFRNEHKLNKTQNTMKSVCCVLFVPVHWAHFCFGTSTASTCDHTRWVKMTNLLSNLCKGVKNDGKQNKTLKEYNFSSRNAKAFILTSSKVGIGENYTNCYKRQDLHWEYQTLLLSFM